MLCASYHSHPWIETGATVWKHSMWVKIINFLSPVTFKIWQMTLKNNRAPFLSYLTLCTSLHSHPCIQIGVTVWKQSIPVKLAILCPMWPWNLTNDFENNRTPLLCYFKLCASFHRHQSIQTGVTVQKSRIQVKIDDFLSCVTFKFDRWPWKNNRLPDPCHIKLCALFHCYMWIQTWVMVQKCLNWFLTSVILTFDLWPWPFAWISLFSMVILWCYEESNIVKNVSQLKILA